MSGNCEGTEGISRDSKMIGLICGLAMEMGRNTVPAINSDRKCTMFFSTNTIIYTISLPIKLDPGD